MTAGLRGLARRGADLLPVVARRLAVAAERLGDAAWQRRLAHRPPADFRVVSYGGHGSPAAGSVVVRARVVDDPEPASAVAGEGTGAAVRRTLARFLTSELPGVPLRVRLGPAEAETVTDAEGYAVVRLPLAVGDGAAPWVTGEMGLAASYRGLPPAAVAPVAVRVRVPGPRASYGVVSDVDDTVLQTGAQRLLSMLRVTLTGSALTRTAFPGAAELYRALAGGRSGVDDNPVFYVSSSPWNLHGFLVDFLAHRRFPDGPLFLRDLLGDGSPRDHATGKLASIEEVLALHPGLPLVLLGDTGQADPEIYAEVVRRHPGRVLAVYLREVRLDPGDGRVEAVLGSWDERVPVLLAADSGVVARHAAGLGLLAAEAVEPVERALPG